MFWEQNVLRHTDTHSCQKVKTGIILKWLWAGSVCPKNTRKKTKNPSTSWGNRTVIRNNLPPLCNGRAEIALQFLIVLICKNTLWLRNGSLVTVTHPTPLRNIHVRAIYIHRGYQIQLGSHKYISGLLPFKSTFCLDDIPWDPCSACCVTGIVLWSSPVTLQIHALQHPELSTYPIFIHYWYLTQLCSWVHIISQIVFLLMSNSKYVLLWTSQVSMRVCGIQLHHDKLRGCGST